jgi:hypothetical protein
MIGFKQIHSSSTESLTTDNLRELKQLLQTAQAQRQEIKSELACAEAEDRRFCQKYYSWKDGILLKRVFKNSFSRHKANAENSTAKVEELQEQLGLTTIATHLEIDKEQGELYFRMRDEFAALTGCSCVWGLTMERSADQFRERTTVNSTVERRRVTLTLSTCELIDWEQKVPLLKSANGGELYLYPGFIIYRLSSEAFSLIMSTELKVSATVVEFREGDGVPSDSPVITYAWAKENKDGTPDRRFANNQQIPVVHYGRLALRSGTGLWEEFLFSVPDRLKAFVTAWMAFETSFGTEVPPS